MVWILNTNSEKVQWKEKIFKSKTILNEHLDFFGVDYKGEGKYDLNDGTYLEIKVIDKAEDLKIEVL